MGAVGCLLLIACLNLSNLLVARAAVRRREIAIRTALGSSRMRLCREQLTESLLICVAGGALGLVLASLVTRWLTTRWVNMPRAEAVHPDAVVVAFAVGITLLTGVLSGLLSAISATGSGVLSALQDASRTIGGSASRTSLRKTLLTAEIALIKHGHQYVDKGTAYYEARYREQQIRLLTNRAQKLGLQVVIPQTA